VPVDSCANPIQTPANNPKSSSWLRRVIFGRNLKVTLLRGVVWAVLAVVGYKLSVVHVRVDGISMLPTCPDQSVYWVSRLAYVWHAPQRGDVVAIRFVQADDSISRLEPPDVMLLKRIIGLPGETVAFKGGRVLINGEILDEPYETLGCDWNRRPVTLGPDQYYVVGDNRSMPPEYHTHGTYERNRIVGKARL
jgi:signal peptidase I